MGRLRGVAAALAACAVVLAVPAGAGVTGPMSNAEKIRRLDIMLMVTGLRCRTTADNFQADYGHFTAKQMALLNRAGARLKADLAARGGAANPNRALDRLSTTMANAYGQGHPWLSCADLKLVTRNLASVSGEETLAEAAGQLLAPVASPQFALARR